MNLFLGHNWFQGILASNEPQEAWLDEGVNEWADTHVMRDLYGARTSGIDWMGWQAELGRLRTAVTNDPASLPSPIATAAYAFVDIQTYGEATYASTARAPTTLENHVRTSKFMAAMKAYAKEFAFKHPTGRDFYAALERELGEDLGWFFVPVFQQDGGMKLAVREAECRAAHPPRGVFGDGAGRKTVGQGKPAPPGT